MNRVYGNWKLMLVLAGVLVAAGCQSEPAQEETPAAEPTPAEAPAAEQPMAGETYTVVRGDNLWVIASMPKIYGNPYEWPLIYKANSDSISDADLINPGQVLNIARGQSQSEIDAAVNHAKTRGAWSLGVTEESDKAYLAQ
jgi:LysM repeat protein